MVAPEALSGRCIAWPLASTRASYWPRDKGSGLVAGSVSSNLVAILGRTAAYEGRVVTWDELTKSEARLTPDLKGLKD